MIFSLSIQNICNFTFLDTHRKQTLYRLVISEMLQRLSNEKMEETETA